MELWDRIENLKNLQNEVARGEATAVQELKELYSLALGKQMKRECLNCRIKAFYEITSLTQQKIGNMKNQKYTFKNEDELVYFGHAHYTKDNLTDDVAIEMVQSNSANAELFNGSFEDIKPKAPKAEAKAKEPKAPKAEVTKTESDSPIKSE